MRIVSAVAIHRTDDVGRRIFDSRHNSGGNALIFVVPQNYDVRLCAEKFVQSVESRVGAFVVNEDKICLIIIFRQFFFQPAQSVRQIRQSFLFVVARQNYRNRTLNCGLRIADF